MHVTMLHKTYKVTGFTADGATYCHDDRPSEPDGIITAGDEWGYAPACKVCHEVIEVTVLSDEDDEEVA